MMTGSAALTQNDFDRLLSWLDTDRERAAQKYREIHSSLVKIFSWRGHHDAEELADEVMNRVAPKAEELSATYVGDPALYFYGVAKKILLECERREAHLPLNSDVNVVDNSAREGEGEEGARMRECLQKCLRKLEPEDRRLILSYYQKSKQAKIDYRRALAEEWGVAPNALRVRVYRIRAGLKSCIKDCLEQVGR